MQLDLCGVKFQATVISNKLNGIEDRIIYEDIDCNRAHLSKMSNIYNEQCVFH